MVTKLETLLLLLGMIGVLAVVAERARFPFPILLVLAGLVIGLTPGLPEVRLNPDLVLMIFLPPLLFAAAWKFPWEDFRANLFPILALAVGLVFATILCVAFTAWWLAPGLTLAGAFVLGAIVSPPDAVAAQAVLRDLRVPRRLNAVLEGESLVNDSSGLVAYQFAVAAVVSGTFSFSRAGGEFVLMSLGGTAIGLLVGYLVTRLYRQLRNPAVEITLSILTPYLAYLPAEKLGVSGVLAVVAAGLYIGHHAWRAMSPESRLESHAVWGFLEYVLNGSVFILIGLQFRSILDGIDDMPLWRLMVLSAAVCLVVIAVRFAWVIPLARIEQRLFRRNGSTAQLSPGALLVASWAGMRGVVSLAAALAIPLTTEAGEPFPGRHLILFLTFCVIFVTLVLQGFSLPWVVRKLRVAESPIDYATEGDARIRLLTSLVAEITRREKSAASPEEAEACAFWREHYTHRLGQLRERLALPREHSSDVARREVRIFPQLMDYARAELSAMRGRGEISEDLRRRIEFDFDMEERRLQRLLTRYV